MKVVLREDVETLGTKGDLVDVADGYARNFLVPKGLAMKATRGVVAQSESMRRNRTARDERERGAAQEAASKLAGGRVVITARAGDAGKLFGSVTTSDIAAAVLRDSGIEIDRRKVNLDSAIHEVGETEVSVQLHRDVIVPVIIVVEAE